MTMIDSRHYMAQACPCPCHYCLCRLWWLWWIRWISNICWHAILL